MGSTRQECPLDRIGFRQTSEAKCRPGQDGEEEVNELEPRPFLRVAADRAELEVALLDPESGLRLGQWEEVFQGSPGPLAPALIVIKAPEPGAPTGGVLGAAGLPKVRSGRKPADFSSARAARYQPTRFCFIRSSLSTTPRPGPFGTSICPSLTSSLGSKSWSRNGYGSIEYSWA